MYIERFRVKNYRSFGDSGEIVLKSGFNIFVGKNNVGKTTLLETVVPGQFSSRAHRTSKTPRNQAQNPNSILAIQFSISGEELRNFLLSTSAQFYVPMNAARVGKPNDEYVRQIEELFQQPSLSFAVEYRTQSSSWNAPNVPSFRGLSPTQHSIQFKGRDDRSGFAVTATQNGNVENLWAQVVEHAKQTIYRFKAERLNISRSSIDAATELAPDASNLPTVLLQLQSRNPQRYGRLTAHLKQIFENVHEIRQLSL